MRPQQKVVCRGSTELRGQLDRQGHLWHSCLSRRADDPHRPDRLAQGRRRRRRRSPQGNAWLHHPGHRRRSGHRGPDPARCADHRLVRRRGRRPDERGDHRHRQRHPGRRSEHRVRDVHRRRRIARHRAADAAAVRLPDRPSHAVHGHGPDRRSLQRACRAGRPDPRRGLRARHDDGHHAGVHDAVDEEGHRQSAGRHGPLRVIRLHRRRRDRPDRRPWIEEHRGDAVPAGPPLPARPNGRDGGRDDRDLRAPRDRVHAARRRGCRLPVGN